MVLCLNFTLLEPKIILIAGTYCLHKHQPFPLGKVQCLFFPVSFSSRIEHGALPISLNEESIPIDTAAMFSFWTLPICESGVPRRKEQLLDQWRKWKGFLHEPGACGYHWFVDQSCRKCCEAGICLCQSYACRLQVSCFWLLRLDSKADCTGGMGNFRGTFYSSLWQIKWRPLLLGGDPVLASSIETPEMNTASQEDRTLTLGF